jgi:sugar porter (SP) family MFS transporter
LCARFCGFLAHKLRFGGRAARLHRVGRESTSYVDLHGWTLTVDDGRTTRGEIFVARSDADTDAAASGFRGERSDGKRTVEHVEDAPEPHRRAGVMVGVLVCIASLGGLLFGYETGLSAAVLQAAKFPWSGDDQMLLTTATLLSALIGALFAGRVADLVGRRDVIMTTTALFTMGSFLSAIAPSVLVLVGGRIITGLAVGAISLAAPLYIAEIAPTARRGALICVFQLMITVGILLAYIGHETVGLTTDGWRILMAAGAVPGLILSALALLLIESPVWLALKGDQEAALAVLDRLGRRDSALDIEAIEAPADDPRSSGLAEVFSLAGRAAIAVGIGLFFVQQFVGINAIIYYPSSLELSNALHFGLSEGPSLVFALCNVLATVVAIVLIDRLGRRRLLLISLAGIASGLVAMAVAASGHVNPADAQTLSTAGLYVFITSFAIGLGPIPWVIAAEILPLHVRGLAMGIVVGSHWLFDSLASPTGRLLDHAFGRPVVLMVYACFALAGLVIVLRRLPETKGLSLAAINRTFTAWALRVRESRFIHYSVAGLATLGGVLTGYNFGVTAVTLLLIDDDWPLTAFDKGALASAILVGLAIGSFFAGPLSDRFGRRYFLMSIAALFVASAFGAALAPSLSWLLAARVAAGVAIGLTGPTAALYVSEVAPAAIRGRLVSFNEFSYGLGVIVAYCVGLLLHDDHDGWRLMFGLIAVPSTIYGLALLPLPESPRWLAAAGRLSEARRSLLRLVGVETDRDGEADRQLAAITADRSTSEADDVGERRGWARLWQPTYRPAIVVGLALMFLLVFSGQGMVAFYAPTILEDIGFSNTTVSLTATLGLAVVSLIMIGVSVAIIDRVGRKPLMVTGLLVMAACLIALAVLSLSHSSDPVARWGQVACLVVYAGTFSLTLAMVAEVVIAELFPQSIRGPASSLSHGMRSLFSIAFAVTFPLLLDWPGLSVTVLVYAAISVVGAFYLLRTLPETKGRSLEDIGDYWSRRVQDPSVEAAKSAQ